MTKYIISQNSLNTMTRRGYKQTKEHRLKIVNSLKGRKLTEETKRKISLSHLGNKNALGHKLSKESKLKISLANRGKHNSPSTEIKKGQHISLTTEFKGEYDNPKWRGDKVGNRALHTWIKRHKSKPEVCENCKIARPYDLANISHQYKRDINDFKWLCRKCHFDFDGRLDRLLEVSKYTRFGGQSR